MPGFCKLFILSMQPLIFNIKNTGNARSILLFIVESYEIHDGESIEVPKITYLERNQMEEVSYNIIFKSNGRYAGTYEGDNQCKKIIENANRC